MGFYTCSESSLQHILAHLTQDQLDYPGICPTPTAAILNGHPHRNRGPKDIMHKNQRRYWAG